jgi:acyl-CoA thioester hydrolase
VTVGFHHEHRVRYGECDMQNVVFNAHYLAFCDDAVDTWFRTLFREGFEAHGWDFMTKRATIEWQSPARLSDVIEMDVAIARWGHTSFDVGVVGTVGDRAVFTATLTYVGVRPGTVEPVPAPELVRSRLGEAA